MSYTPAAGSRCGCVLGQRRAVWSWSSEVKGGLLGAQEPRVARAGPGVPGLSADALPPRGRLSSPEPPFRTRSPDLLSRAAHAHHQQRAGSRHDPAGAAPRLRHAGSAPGAGTGPPVEPRPPAAWVPPTRSPNPFHSHPWSLPPAFPAPPRTRVLGDRGIARPALLAGLFP